MIFNVLICEIPEYALVVPGGKARVL